MPVISIARSLKDAVIAHCQHTRSAQSLTFEMISSEAYRLASCLGIREGDRFTFADGSFFIIESDRIRVQDDLTDFKLHPPTVKK